MRRKRYPILAGNWDPSVNPTFRKGGENWGPLFLFLQIDVLHFFDGARKEAGAETAEFFY